MINKNCLNNSKYSFNQIKKIKFKTQYYVQILKILFF